MLSLSPRVKVVLYKNKQWSFLFALMCLTTVTVLSNSGQVNLLSVDNDDLLRTVWEERQRGQASQVLSVEERAKGPLQADDPDLLRLLKERYLSPPGEGPLDLILDREDEKSNNYNIYRSAFPSWIHINNILKELFSNEPPNFFVEAGALDGEFISNTLFLERDLGWKGLLVEADPALYSSLPGKNRKAWSSQTCLSPSSIAQKMTFESYTPKDNPDIASALLVRSTGNLAGIRSPTLGKMGSKIPVEVQCFPLYSYLLALNATSVGYVSLDVEGAEAEILLNLPWDKIDVTVWSIEHRTTNDRFKTLYEEPLGVKAPPKPPPPPPPPPASSASSDSQDKQEAAPVKVVYVTQHDPRDGKDDYLVRFMREKGYRLYDYWDGDYTFIKADSDMCRKHCKDT